MIAPQPNAGPTDGLVFRLRRCLFFVVILSRTGVPGERALCACWGGLAKDPRIRGGTDAWCKIQGSFSYASGDDEKQLIARMQPLTHPSPQHSTNPSPP